MLILILEEDYSSMIIKKIGGVGINAEDFPILAKAQLYEYKGGNIFINIFKIT